MDVFRVLLVAAFVLTVSISGYFRRRADVEAGGVVAPEGEARLILVTRRVLVLAMLALVVGYVVWPRGLAWAALPLTELVRWIAGLLALMVIPLLAYWVFSSLNRNVTPTVATRQDHRLVTSGPYRWVRHPLYTLGFAFWALMGVLAANWLFWLVAVTGLALMVLRVPSEEAQLVARFGDEYRAYMRRTGRYLPRLGQFGQ